MSIHEANMAEFEVPLTNFLQAKNEKGNDEDNYTKAKTALKDLIKSDLAGFTSYRENIKPPLREIFETIMKQEQLLPEFHVEDGARNIFMNAVQETPIAIQEALEAKQVTPSAIQEALEAKQVTPTAIQETPTKIQETPATTPAAVHDNSSANHDSASAVHDTASAVKETPTGIQEIPAAIDGYLTACYQLDKYAEDVGFSEFLARTETLPDDKQILIKRNIPPATLWTLISQIAKCDGPDRNRGNGEEKDSVEERLSGE
jgi:hypothetical protein